MTASREPVPSPTARFGYFVVQTQVVHDEAGVALSGVLEDLGTGEKRTFSGGDGLARLLAEWAMRSGVPP